jgi:RNA polymerase sigma-70 factor (ECF subfamily)
MQLMHTDAELITRSVEDPEEFAGIFDRHQQAVYAFLRRRVGPDLADEWLGETFAQAFRSRTRYVARHETCRAWLLGIATHLIANHRRAEHRRLAAIRRAAGRARTDVAGDADEIVARVTARASSAQLARALRSMDRRDRDVLLLYAWADLSYSEIAEALDIPVGTVRSRLNRARGVVGAALGRSAASSRGGTVISSPGENHA